MPCYHPLRAFKTDNGDVVFSELKRHGSIIAQIQLPCGQCVGCRLERSRQWAMRCVHETNLYKRNCFITLTYNDENLPHRGQLTYEDFQLFMKRLRKKHGDNIRFYLGAEYGTDNDRPHFHAILFNHDWDDKKYFKTSASGEKIYTSDGLSRLWPYGFTSTGNATFESAAYIARYCMSKVTGEAADEHYKRYDYLGEYQLTPEFNKMSLKPGIGGDWLKFYKKDVYTSDKIVINGVESNAPKYYDKLFKRMDRDAMDQFKADREYRGYQNRDDNTPERLAVKETVTQAKIKALKRGKV